MTAAPCPAAPCPAVVTVTNGDQGQIADNDNSRDACDYHPGSASRRKGRLDGDELAFGLHMRHIRPAWPLNYLARTYTPHGCFVAHYDLPLRFSGNDRYVITCAASVLHVTHAGGFFNL